MKYETLVRFVAGENWNETKKALKSIFRFSTMLQAMSVTVAYQNIFHIETRELDGDYANFTGFVTEILNLPTLSI